MALKNCSKSPLVLTNENLGAYIFDQARGSAITASKLYKDISEVFKGEKMLTLSTIKKYMLKARKDLNAKAPVYIPNRYNSVNKKGKIIGVVKAPGVVYGLTELFSSQKPLRVLTNDKPDQTYPYFISVSPNGKWKHISMATAKSSFQPELFDYFFEQIFGSHPLPVHNTTTTTTIGTTPTTAAATTTTTSMNDDNELHEFNNTNNNSDDEIIDDNEDIDLSNFSFNN